MDKNKFQIHVDSKTLKDPSKTKKLAMLQKSNPSIEFDLEPTGGSSSSSSMSMAAQMEENEVIQPQDQATIKYLSNVKDANTGEISKPFNIADKNYQMVRGIHPSNGIVMGVMCLNDMDDNGDNIIHPVEYFEENIAKPMKEAMGMMGADIQPRPTEEDYDYSGEELAYHDKQEWDDYINLKDVAGYKLFFVDTKNNQIIAKFKNITDMLKSGIKLNDGQKLVNKRKLMAMRAGETIREAIKLDEITADGIDTEKLKGDVKILVDRMTKMFGNYFAKLDTDVEKGAFLKAIAQIVNVPDTKMASIIKTYRDLAKDYDQKSDTQAKPAVTESKKVLKVIKVKDIK
jgi:hypothetical protein